MALTPEQVRWVAHLARLELDDAALARMARQLASHCSPESLLSEREKEVIRLIACGKTNTEIASHLFLSPHTVKSHVSHILQKLELPNRTEVAIFAVRAGLADTPR